MKPFIITARSVENFESMVHKALQGGYGIDNAPFVVGTDLNQLLCQWMKPMPNYYEWNLAVGVSLGDLQAEVQKYCSEGFDFLYNPLAFEPADVFVQWVQRWKVTPNALTEEVEQRLAESIHKDLQLVEGVRPMQLVERGEFSSSNTPLDFRLCSPSLCQSVCCIATKEG